MNTLFNVDFDDSKYVEKVTDEIVPEICSRPLSAEDDLPSHICSKAGIEIE